MMPLAKITKTQLILAEMLKKCASVNKSRQDIVKDINAGKDSYALFRARIDEDGNRKPRDVQWLNNQVALLLRALNNVANGGVQKERTIVKDATTGEDAVVYKEIKVSAHDANLVKMANDYADTAKRYYIKGKRGKSGVQQNAVQIAKMFAEAGALDF